MEFELTYKGILALLNKDGINARGKLKKALEQATIKDLTTLKRSIQEEINQREVLCNGTVSSYKS